MLTCLSGACRGATCKRSWLREIAGNVKVLLAANPTRGVDVGAAEFIHQQILQARDSGVAVVLISSELDEVRLLSDRIIVMENGQFHGPFDPTTSEYTLGLYMSGGATEDPFAVIGEVTAPSVRHARLLIISTALGEHERVGRSPV